MQPGDGKRHFGLVSWGRVLELSVPTVLLLAAAVVSCRASVLHELKGLKAGDGFCFQSLERRESSEGEVTLSSEGWGNVLPPGRAVLVPAVEAIILSHTGHEVWCCGNHLHCV